MGKKPALILFKAILYSPLSTGNSLNLDIIKTKIAPVIESLGYEIVDIELAKRLGATHLTFFIWHETHPITFDDCEKVHTVIGPALDELNPSGDAPYTLNVSSPGLDRPFKVERDFMRNIGQKVEVKLYAPLKGKKLYEGVLLKKGEHIIIIDAEAKGKKEEIQFELAKIVYVRPYVSFEGL